MGIRIYKYNKRNAFLPKFSSFIVFFLSIQKFNTYHYNIYPSTGPVVMNELHAKIVISAVTDLLLLTAPCLICPSQGQFLQIYALKATVPCPKL